MIFTFQSPGISPALWGQADGNNPARCPTLHNRKSQQGKCPNVITPSLPRHCGDNQKVYSCPMKTHHSPDAHICGLSKAVQNCVIYNYYLGHMRCFRTKISIQVTPLTHDVTSASKLRKSHFWRIQKDPKISFKCFLFASRSPVISPQL